MTSGPQVVYKTGFCQCSQTEALCKPTRSKRNATAPLELKLGRKIKHSSLCDVSHVYTVSQNTVKRQRSLFGPGRRVPKSQSSCCCCCCCSCCYQFSKNPKAFLICSGAQRNFAYTFVLTFSTDTPSQIFILISNKCVIS